MARSRRGGVSRKRAEQLNREIHRLQDQIATLLDANRALEDSLQRVGETVGRANQRAAKMLLIAETSLDGLATVAGASSGAARSTLLALEREGRTQIRMVGDLSAVVGLTPMDNGEKAAA